MECGAKGIPRRFRETQRRPACVGEIQQPRTKRISRIKQRTGERRPRRRRQRRGRQETTASSKRSAVAETPQTNTQRAETRTRTSALISAGEKTTRREKSRNTEQIAVAAAEAGLRIRVPHHVQCRRRLRRARRRHVAGNRDGLQGDAHEIGLCAPIARNTPSLLVPVSASRSTDQASVPGKPRRGRTEKKVPAKSDSASREEPREQQQWRWGASREPEEGPSPRLYRFHSSNSALTPSHLFALMPRRRLHPRPMARRRLTPKPVGVSPWHIV
jgi:hypothetical protein